jgi:hypothetical protein
MKVGRKMVTRQSLEKMGNYSVDSAPSHAPHKCRSINIMALENNVKGAIKQSKYLIVGKIHVLKKALVKSVGSARDFPSV